MASEASAAATSSVESAAAEQAQRSLVRVLAADSSAGSDREEWEHVAAVRGAVPLVDPDPTGPAVADQYFINTAGSDGKVTTASFQNAVNAAISASDFVGGTLFVPAGTWRIGEILIDLTGRTNTTAPALNILGAGSNAAYLDLDPVVTSGKLLKFKGHNGAAGAELYITVSDLCLLGHGIDQTCGLYVENCAGINLNNVRVRGFGDGIWFRSVLGANISGGEVRWNARGITMDRLETPVAGFTFPNANSLRGVKIGNNYKYGCLVDRGTLLDIVGGSFEANGDAADTTISLTDPTCGLCIKNAGVEGGVGLCLLGVLFSNNYGAGDVWIDCKNDGNPIMHYITGCSFAPTTDDGKVATQRTRSSIKFTGNTTNNPAILYVEGNAFLPVTSTSSIKYKYINVNTAADGDMKGNKWDIVGMATNIQAASDAAIKYKDGALGGFGDSLAEITFTVSGGVVTTGYQRNATVAKTETGKFVVTFTRNLPSSPNAVLVTPIANPSDASTNVATATVLSQTVSSVTILTAVGGTATDLGASVVVHGMPVTVNNP